MNIGYIYLITNLINNKKYIGQTQINVLDRWKQHCNRAKVSSVNGIDGAIRKYGVENFSYQIIRECPVEELDKWEIYYIKKYNTFQGDSSNKGYNLTKGGQGRLLYDIDELKMLEMYNNGMSAVDIGKYFNCSDRTIGKRLKKYGVDTKKHQQEWLQNNKEKWNKNLEKGRQSGKGKFKVGDNTKPVYLVELNKTFNSLKECSIWLFENNYTKASSWESVQKGLSRCLTQNKETYLKMHFRYI